MAANTDAFNKLYCGQVWIHGYAKIELYIKQKYNNVGQGRSIADAGN